MTKKRHILLYISTMLFLFANIYIWVFLSEPIYENRKNTKIQKYDFVTVDNIYGLVVRVTKDKLLIADDTYYTRRYYEFATNNKSIKFIGAGTLHHKLNLNAGFHITMIFTILTIIAMIIYSLIFFLDILQNDYYK